MFLSVGVSRGRDLQAPGVELDGVVKAVDYLLNVNRGYRMDLGRRVVVIGGGFVAFDAARTALRAGREAEPPGRSCRDRRARERSARLRARGDSRRRHRVTVVSLEDFGEMPVLRTTQGHEEFEEAKREGVRFITRRGPKRFVGNGRLARIELRGGAIGLRRRAAASRPSSWTTTCSTSKPTPASWPSARRPICRSSPPADDVALTPGGTIRIDPGHARHIGAGRVCRRRRRLRSAQPHRGRGQRQACRALDSRVPRGTERPASKRISRSKPSSTSRYRMVAGFERFDREAPPTLDVGRRTGIAEVETGYDANAARIQAARCLVCHVQTIYDPERCVLCNRCVDICPEYCLSFVPLDALDLPGGCARGRGRRARKPSGFPLAALIKDDDRCIRCGLCAIRCPTGAMTMERFTITERWTVPTESPWECTSP